ncbi:16279_t:CDS:1, partial [Funneliformis mosseae]
SSLSMSRVILVHSLQVVLDTPVPLYHTMISNALKIGPCSISFFRYMSDLNQPFRLLLMNFDYLT